MSLEFNCVLFIDLMNYLSLHQSFTKVLAAFVKGNARGVATLCTQETTDRRDVGSTSSDAAVLFSRQNYKFIFRKHLFFPIKKRISLLRNALFVLFKVF